MILILRGHIRDSFETIRLFNLIKSMYNINNNLTIYIHTWNVIANNISWRPIRKNDNVVTNEMIYNYFGNLKHLIKHIIIDDDKNIKLIGNLNGNVSSSKMPLIGWKNYWYGKYSIINYIREHVNTNETIINCRFDILTNSFKNTNYQIINFIATYIKYRFKKIIFINNRIGVDNIYIGNIYNMYKLTHNFHYLLDNIVKRNPGTIHQEELVYNVNRRLF